MTTSGDTAWPMTATDIVKAAMGEIAVIDPGSDPEADELRDCLLRLNGMLKSWQLKGAGLSREASGTVTTVGGSASGTLDADVRAISSARLVVSATQDRLLYPMDRSRYLSMPNKTTVGSPSMYYFSRQASGVELFIWPVPAAAATIKIDYDRVIETVTSGTETLDLREELQETVYANLAVRIAGIFGQQAPAELIARAQMLETQMFDAERPDFYSFQSEYDYA